METTIWGLGMHTHGKYAVMRSLMLLMYGSFSVGFGSGGGVVG